MSEKLRSNLLESVILNFMAVRITEKRVYYNAHIKTYCERLCFHFIAYTIKVYLPRSFIILDMDVDVYESQ